MRPIHWTNVLKHDAAMNSRPVRSIETSVGAIALMVSTSVPSLLATYASALPVSTNERSEGSKIASKSSSRIASSAPPILTSIACAIGALEVHTQKAASQQIRAEGGM